MPATTPEQLRTVLTERQDQLAALPDVTGWGVGLDRQGHPIVQVFVSAPASDELLAELGRLFERFAVVLQSRPAEAD